MEENNCSGLYINANPIEEFLQKCYDSGLKEDAEKYALEESLYQDSLSYPNDLKEIIKNAFYRGVLWFINDELTIK